MTEDILQIDGLLKHVSKGLPLPLEAEHVRLPRFTRCLRVEQLDLGQKGKEPVIVCLSRTATFAFWCEPSKGKFSVKDADRFLKLMTAVHEKFPEKPVKGYVVVSQRPETAAAAKLAKAGHLVSPLTDTPPATTATPPAVATA